MNFKQVNLNSIRSKLIISLVAICVIPLIIAGYCSYTQSKSILSKNLTTTSTQTLTEVDNGLTDYFTGLSRIVSIISNNYNLINIDTGDNFKYVPNILKSIKESDQDIFGLYYTPIIGKCITYPVQKLPDNYDATTEDWYKQALAHKGNVVITPPYKDVATGINMVSFVRTVEKDGQVVGVLSMDCTLTTLSEKMAKNKIGDSGYAFILDLSGNALTHPQKEIVNTDLGSKLSFWNEAKSKDNGFVNYEFNGEKKFGVYQTNKLTGWKLIAALPESELTNSTGPIWYSTLLIILAMGLISVVISLFLSKGISHNIKQLKEVFVKASNGDLTVSIIASTKDEFKDLSISFNSMIKNISELMNSVTKSSKTVLETSTNLASMSEEVTASINEVARAMGEVSTGATEQAQNAQNSASTMDDLSKRLDKISVNSNEMDTISGDTKELGSKGLHMIDTLIEKSSKTKTATTEVNDIVQDMNESTKQINAISETISNITAQTNLLALNASIESARAGEAGRGFAVVAEEIRKLAEQSKTSTEEIKVIISGIQTKSDIAVNAIKTTETVVNEQDLAVVQTKEIFSEILKSIETMITKVCEVKISIADINEKKKSTVAEIENISAISEQTASATQEVTASTEEITATMEEFTKYSEDLQILAEQLGTEINKFKIN